MNSNNPFKGFRLSLLPVDLLSLPVVLVLLALMPIGCALSVLCLTLLVVLWRIHREDALASRLPGLLRLGLVVGSFAISGSMYPSCYECHLSSQLLWLGWFVALSAIHYLHKGFRGRTTQVFDGDDRCCAGRRRVTLELVYRRIDRVVIIFSSITLMIALPLVYFAKGNLYLDRTLSICIATSALGLIIYQLLSLSWISRQLYHEYWIPIVNDQDEVVGRTPESHLVASQGRLPIVRLIAYSQGMIYLERKETLMSTAEWVDTPFSTWLHEGEHPAEAAQRLIDERFCGIRRASPKALLRYHTSEHGQDLLVYLYTVEIESPDMLWIDCKPIVGRWWSMNQLRPQIDQSEFSPYLCSELPLLEQTILLAQQLNDKRNHTSK